MHVAGFEARRRGGVMDGLQESGKVTEHSPRDPPEHDQPRKRPESGPEDPRHTFNLQHTVRNTLVGLASQPVAMP